MNGIFLPGASVFNLYSENGLPPEISVMIAHDNGYTVEWPSFINEALNNGWSIKHTFNTIVSAVRDSDIFSEKQLAEFIKISMRYFVDNINKP